MALLPTHLASVATKKKIKKDKSSRSRTRGLAGVIERIEQREAEFSSGTICILSDKEDEDNVHSDGVKKNGKNVGNDIRRCGER